MTAERLKITYSKQSYIYNEHSQHQRSFKKSIKNSYKDTNPVLQKLIADIHNEQKCCEGLCKFTECDFQQGINVVVTWPLTDQNGGRVNEGESYLRYKRLLGGCGGYRIHSTQTWINVWTTKEKVRRPRWTTPSPVGVSDVTGSPLKKMSPPNTHLNIKTKPLLVKYEYLYIFIYLSIY